MISRPHITTLVFFAVLLSGCERNQQPATEVTQTGDNGLDPVSSDPAVSSDDNPSTFSATVGQRREPLIFRRPSNQDIDAASQLKLDSSDCAEMGRAAKAQGIRNFVVSFEGLASKGAGFVRRNLMRKLQDEFGRGFVTKNYGWNQSDSAFSCVQRFSQAQGSEGQVSIIGHSFGAGIATFSLLEKMSGANLRAKVAVTLDPRTWSTDSSFRSNRNFFQFQKQANVGSHLNYWQGGGLRGYGVQGADNREITATGHTGLPSDPTVYAGVREFFLREMTQAAPPQTVIADDESESPIIDDVNF